MANENTEFSTELRGYKRSEVDSALNELRGELIKAAKDRQAMLEEVAGLKEQISALDASPGGALAPSFAGWADGLNPFCASPKSNPLELSARQILIPSELSPMPSRKLRRLRNQRG